MHPKPAQPQPRIELVDALRGSALFGILLLHSVEHFDFVAYPESPPDWLRSLNSWTVMVADFLFSGKAYSLFAMMFGLSFFIILDRAAARGVDFRWRFLWRLTVLGLIGYLHSLVYCGDILSMLAVLGLPLVLLYGLGTRALTWVSVALLAQLPLWWQFARWLIDSSYVPPPGHAWGYYGEIYRAFGGQGLLEVFRANAIKGNLAKWWWMIDNGRYLQMFGLFTWGLMLGRLRVFEHPTSAVRLAKRALMIALPVAVALFLVERNLGHWFPEGPGRRLSFLLTNSYFQLAQMVTWVAAFILLFHLTRVRSLLTLLAPYGRMSLTCYVTQALFWVPIYYHFGLGMFRQWGQFYSILGGAAFFVVQLAAAHWWLKRFHYGPFEWLWRCGTYLTFATPFRKRPVVPPTIVPETPATV